MAQFVAWMEKLDGWKARRRLPSAQDKVKQFEWGLLEL